MSARDDWPHVWALTSAYPVSLHRRDGLEEMFDEIDRLRTKERAVHEAIKTLAAETAALAKMARP